MEINYFAIIVATVLQFIVGAFWYTALFGKLWGKMHGFDKLSKAVQQKMMQSMGPIYGVQFLVTLLSSYMLAVFMTVAPQTWSPQVLALLLWAGFVVPTQVSGVLFGGTESKWIVTKIVVLAGGLLLPLQVAAFVLSNM